MEILEAAILYTFDVVEDLENLFEVVRKAEWKCCNRRRPASFILPLPSIQVSIDDPSLLHSRNPEIEIVFIEGENAGEDDNRDPWLLRLPDEVLGYLLEFLKPNHEFATEQWQWVGQIGRVCRDFRALSRELAPETLNISSVEATEKPDLVHALVRSVCATEWKRMKLVEFQIERCERRTYDVFYRFCLESTAFPKLEKLTLKMLHPNHFSRMTVGFFDPLFQNRALPRLSHLTLAGVPLVNVLSSQIKGRKPLQHPLKSPLSSQIRGRKPLLRPLKSLTISGIGLFIPNQWSGELEHALRKIAVNCCQLESLSVPRLGTFDPDILRMVLERNRGLRKLDLSRCRPHEDVTELVSVLVTHAPQLESLVAQSCAWMTDDNLDRLVQGLIDHWVARGRKEIPLCHVDARRHFVGRPGVSSSGRDLILSKPHIGRLEVRVGYCDLY